MSSCLYVNDRGISKIYFSNFQAFGDVGIKQSPITNREYIIFLCWQIDVYGDTYPERIIHFLPLSDRQKLISPFSLLNGNQNQRSETDYQALLNNVQDTVFQNYTLNPKYLDYPVIGLSKNQVFKVLKWLNDRYNEYSLIKIGILHFNPNQKNEDCFVLESYISGQYEGDVRKVMSDERTGSARNPRWNDGFFIPTFRLPYESELKTLTQVFEKPFELEPYKFHEKHFLSDWNTYYISTENDIITLNVNTPLQLSNQLNEVQLHKLKVEKGKLTEECYQNIKYFEHAFNSEIPNAYRDKDKYGHMDFLIISEAGIRRAVIGELKEFENGDDQKNMISWVFYDDHMNFEDLPKGE